MQGAGGRGQGQAQIGLEPRWEAACCSGPPCEATRHPQLHAGSSRGTGRGSSSSPKRGLSWSRRAPAAAVEQDKPPRLTADPDAQHQQAARCHGPRLPWCCTRPGQPRGPGASGSQCSPGRFSPTSFQIPPGSVPPLPRGYFPSASGEGGRGGTWHGDTEHPTRDGSSGTAGGTTRIPAAALVEGSTGESTQLQPPRAHGCGAGAVAAAEASRTQTWAGNKGGAPWDPHHAAAGLEQCSGTRGRVKGVLQRSILLGQHQPCCTDTACTGHGWITLGTAGDSDPKTGKQQGAGGLALRGRQPQTPLEEESTRGRTSSSWTGWVAQPHPASAMGCLATPCCTQMDWWHFPTLRDIPVP